MPIVDYNMDNAGKCQCAKCPVQADSACAQEKIQKMMQMKEQMQSMDGGGMPEPQMMPGLYCAEAVGKASCDDLDFAQGCICDTCLVHQEHNLKSYRYCREGSAEQNG